MWTQSVTPDKVKRYVAMTLQIIIGCAIIGLAYPLFLIPHHLVPGGMSGIAIILNYFFATPVGLVIIALNIPVFLMGLRTMGRKYVVNSVAGMILSRLTGMSVGFGILITDCVIISAAGLAFRNLEAPLFGYIVLFLSTKVIDIILEGWSFSKLVIITSSKTHEIQDFIINTLERSGTALKSRSLFLNREGEIILTVIPRKQLADLREFIKNIDPLAFVIINDTYDILGKGFKSTLFT